MTLPRFARALALVAVLGVLAVLLFPAIQGPYSAVHGPVTALQSARASAGLRMAIMHAGVSIPGAWLSDPNVSARNVIDLPIDSHTAGLPDEQDLILRC
jgi:hypothetical protein